ncbi:MAG: homoserine kinase [Halofilum sp. (in: g-proteobacteria)]
MAVYTALSDSDLEGFLDRYQAGRLIEWVGIRDGIENSNFFITTDQGSYVLTLFEQHPAEELPYFLNLTAHLADHGVPCAHPIADTEGQYLQRLMDKPAALVERLSGRTLEQPGPFHCAAVGDALGRMHVASESFGEVRENERGSRWWYQTAKALRPHLTKADRDLLAEELRYQRRLRYLDLPRGTIHADLFRDNVLFDGDTLSGMIDFYYACHDCLLYDVAITVNDWCRDTDNELESERTEALLNAYAAVRPFTKAEAGAWDAMLRAAALRFWLSRLFDLHFPRPAEIPHTKDPDEYRQVLLARRGDNPALAPLAVTE